MAGQISPVLLAYLQGQQQQTNLANTAQDIIQRRQEAQQRQQQIDEVIKQHGAENANSQRDFELRQDIERLNHQKAVFDVENQVREGLRTGSITPQTSLQSSPMSIPGVQGLTQPVTIPGADSLNPSQQTSPQQTVDTPFGKVSVAMPKTAIQQQVDLENALAPIKVDQAVRQFKETKEPQYLAQIDAANQRASDTDQRARDIADQRYQLGLTLGELRSNINNNKLTGGMVGAPLQEHIDSASRAAAVGHYDIAKEPYPEVKQMLRNFMLAKGLDPDIPDKTFTQIYSIANGAVDVKNTIDAMNSAIAAPKNWTGRLADAISGGIGYEGLGVDKPTYQMFAAKLAPTLEIASGMSPGSMRSTALLNMFKGLVRQAGNSAKDIAEKDYMAVGIPLTAASKQMSVLPTEQRKLVWGQIIKDNPRLMTMHPEVTRSLANAVQTGNFEPSKDLKDFLANASK